MSYINIAALDAAPLKTDPFQYLVVPDFLSPEALAEINPDYPDISLPRNYALDEVTYGPAFERLLDEINDSDFAAHLGSKFNVSLDGASTTITVRKYCEASDGNIHTDHWSKIITVLIYFNEQWEHEAGQLRMLRSSSDIEDYADEVKPLGGTLLAFRRSANSYHGHKRFVGERRMLQMNWVSGNPIARTVQRLDRFSTHFMKRVLRLGS